jgi:hypothetical protein
MVIAFLLIWIRNYPYPKISCHSTSFVMMTHACLYVAIEEMRMDHMREIGSKSPQIKKKQTITHI